MTDRKKTCVSYMRFTLVMLIVLLLRGITEGQTLLVCVPGKQNTPYLQNCFDSLLGRSQAIVFGRIKDLEATVQAKPDAAIIALAPFFDFVPGYKIALVGKNKKKNGEKYYLVASSKEITKENIPQKKVGIIELLYKEHLPKFVKDLFNIEIKSLKRVNKEDDLLTMLGIEAVDAIIVSSSQYKEILSNTKLPLTIITTSGNDVGFAVCAAKEGTTHEKLFNALLKAPTSMLDGMELDAWEKP